MRVVVMVVVKEIRGWEERWCGQRRGKGSGDVSDEG